MKFLPPSGPAFARAVKAVITGDTAALRAALSAEPALVRARSRAAHRATLLHYTAANGIEDVLQREVENADEIAGLLLDAGAAPDAPCDAYDGRYPTTLNLVVSSDHPNAAGVAGRLIAVLCAHGAAVDGVEGDGSPLATALCFANLDSVEALLTAGARSENVVFAAAAGRTDGFVPGSTAIGTTTRTPASFPLSPDRRVAAEQTSSSPACADGPTWSTSSSAAASTSMPARREVSAPDLRWGRDAGTGRGCGVSARAWRRSAHQGLALPGHGARLDTARATPAQGAGGGSSAAADPGRR